MPACAHQDHAYAASSNEGTELTRDITDVIRQFWDRRAGIFDEEDPDHGLVDEDQRLAWLELLGRLVGPNPRSVLDVGCGTGFLALRFAELGYDVTGVDLAPRMIAQARRKAEQAAARIEFRVATATALELPDATFDVVAARHVIWNLPDPAAGLAEWLRVLRPGGRLVLIEGTWTDNEEIARKYARPTARLATWASEAATRLPFGIGSSYAQRRLDHRYRRIEVQLPWSGGPAADDLAALLRAGGLQEVTVEPLMDPVLWGGAPSYPHYVATGRR